jgi:hypothetical protein
MLLIPLIYFGITRRLMGQLGRSEYRNKSGHVAIIEAPDGSVAIERARLHYSGILVSLAKFPRFGRFFFTGRNAVLRPVNAPRISFVEARSGLVANTGLVALAETLSGNYQPVNQKPGVPRADSIENLIIWMAENKYFPSLIYQPRVTVLTPEQQKKLKDADPIKYQQWVQEYIADQLEAIHFEIQRVNELSLLNEIKTGTLRKITTLDKNEVDNTTLLVKPTISSKIASKPLRRDERQQWFMKMVTIFASWPEAWPAEVGGREVDIREIFKWNLSTFSQGDVSQLDDVTRQIDAATRKTDTIRLVVIAIVFIMIMVGVVILFKGLGIV